MVDYGLKVSLPGKDVSSVEPLDFVFNTDSDFNTKIVLQAAGSKVISASSFSDISVTHSLGFIPMVMMFVESDPTTNIWRMGCHFNNGQDGHIDNDGLNTYADDTYLKFRIYNGFGSQKTIKYYYFIFGDNAS